MRVIDVRCHVLLDPGYDVTATSSAQDTIVVEVLTDEGITGIGETDLNAWVAHACIEAPGTHTMDQGLRQMLVGLDPLDPEATWRRLYVGTAMTGRRGAALHALGAIDIALWDICGKAQGVPCWQLWGPPAAETLTPYASLQPEVSSYDEYLESIQEWATRAIMLGFHAVKLEATFSGPYRHRGLDEPDERIAEVVAAVRGAVGPAVAIMVDVQYAFDSVSRALNTAEALAEHDVFFLEAPLWPDDLDAYRELSRRSPVRIAGGEWLSTRFEHVDLMDRGGVQVDQPDIGRVGGLTEARRVCDLAAERGRLVVPHAWKTGISVAAAAQLAAVTAHMPFFEFLPDELCESALRKEVADDGLHFDGGGLQLPDRPGIGVELDRDALERFAQAARARAPITI
jgi:L-alanine-DL-glutamate epimerase-like enolase superfamily enzyme